MSQRLVNQSFGKAGRDMIAGDQNNYYYNSPAPKPTVIEQLLARLQQEMENNSQVRTMIDSLLRYHQRNTYDGVIGLEAKLERAGRVHEIDSALEKKELFAKVLEKWSMYESAQEIFVYLLARAEVTFQTIVLPRLDAANEVQVNEIITDRIVEPIVQDCGASVFKINHSTAMGMLYWLAEQCFVRWHR